MNHVLQQHLLSYSIFRAEIYICILSNVSIHVPMYALAKLYAKCCITIMVAIVELGLLQTFKFR